MYMTKESRGATARPINRVRRRALARGCARKSKLSFFALSRSDSTSLSAVATATEERGRVIYPRTVSYYGPQLYAVNRPCSRSATLLSKILDYLET